MPRRDKVCERAVRSVVEALENRTMLTTVMGGGVDPVTGLPIVNQFRYLDASNHVAVVSVGGNTTAEFIFAFVPMMSGQITNLGDHTPPPPPNVQAEGQDLFSIYVSQADASSFISVSEIDRTNGRLIPFNGSAGTFRVSNAQSGQSIQITPDGGTGSMILGTRTKSTAPSDNIALTSRRWTAPIGVRPNTGRVIAGLEVAPGLDFGKFFFGGTVTGQVSVTGS